MQTLIEAAKTNWRAAAYCMKRLDPDRFANPNPTIVTQSEANRFAINLSKSIELAALDPRDRADLLKLVSAAMPAAMRRCWAGRGVDHQIEQALRECDEKRSAEALSWRAAKDDRDIRRQKLLAQLRPHVPRGLYETLSQNVDAVNPEEVFVPSLQLSTRQASDVAESHVDRPATNPMLRRTTT
jgi:hypothetical protein